jgi:DNA-binding transcriptional ArsR family regulator
VYKSNNQPDMITEISYVDYGEHIGEYIKYKLKKLGMKQSFLADALGITKQAVTYHLSKAEMVPSEINRLQSYLPNDFFDEFYSKNPEAEVGVSEKTSVNFSQPMSPVKGLSLLIQIDPVDFDPAHVDALGTSIKEALEAFHKRISTK